jgi:FkbM family methyltransferase
MLIYGTYDRALHNAIEDRVKPGMICMDVGANLGEMALHMASKVGSQGMVYAFEPVPHVYQRLLTHIARNRCGRNVQAFDLALSDSNSRVLLSFTDPSADNQALGSIVNTHRSGLTRQADVQTCTLDHFVAEYGIPRIDFMKVDIQGAEWLLLQGGQQVFSRLAPELLMEISPSDLCQIGRDSRQLAALLEGFSYEIYSLGRDGKPEERLCASTLDPSFRASNVLCTKRPMA